MKLYTENVGSLQQQMGSVVEGAVEEPRLPMHGRDGLPREPNMA